jgi:hypothetical protein
MASLFANQATKKSQQQQQGNGHVSNTGDWIPDDDGDVCNRCFKQVKAGLFTSGKHHCRRCGQMVCGLCSKKKISLARLGKGSDPVRVCDHCYSHEARRAACLAEYIPKLMQGNVFVKFPSEGTTGMGKAHPRVVRLSSDQKNIIWHKQGETSPKATACINVQEITQVSPNLTSQRARKAVEKSGAANCCFSIVANSRSLDLECSSPEERNSWIQCFGEFVKFAKLETPEDMRQQSQQNLVKQAQKEEAQRQREERKAHREKLRAKYSK